MRNYYEKSVLFLAITLFASIFAQAQFTDGIIVLNEGGAGSGNASVSFINNSGQLQNNIFGLANSGSTLGDTGQSMGFNGNYAYVVLNISNAIKIVNRANFQFVASITTGLTNPRFIAFSGNKAYVTCWGDAGQTTDDYVAVIDLSNHTILTTIPVNEGPERIIEHNGKLYVAHQGGYGFGNSISVIDPATDTVLQSIVVGDVPNSMTEKEGILYVLCGGKPSWAGTETNGELAKIDLSNNSVIDEKALNGHPANLEIANEKFFYSIDADIFASDMASETFPSTPLFSIAPQGSYGVYGMDIIDDKIYVADAVNYVSPGKAYVYSTAGTLEQTYTVGVIPSNFYKVETTLGTPDFAANSDVKIYPNPASANFYISSNQPAAVKMYDVAGRLVKNEAYSVSGVSVSDLNRGIYLVEITVDNSKSIKRISIK